MGNRFALYYKPCKDEAKPKPPSKLYSIMLSIPHGVAAWYLPEMTIAHWKPMLQSIIMTIDFPRYCSSEFLPIADRINCEWPGNFKIKERMTENVDLKNDLTLETGCAQICLVESGRENGNFLTQTLLLSTNNDWIIWDAEYKNEGECEIAVKSEFRIISDEELLSIIERYPRAGKQILIRFEQMYHKT